MKAYVCGDGKNPPLGIDVDMFCACFKLRATEFPTKVEVDGAFDACPAPAWSIVLGMHRAGILLELVAPTTSRVWYRRSSQAFGEECCPHTPQGNPSVPLRDSLHRRRYYRQPVKGVRGLLLCEVLYEGKPVQVICLVQSRRPRWANNAPSVPLPDRMAMIFELECILGEEHSPSREQTFLPYPGSCGDFSVVSTFLFCT